MSLLKFKTKIVAVKSRVLERRGIWMDEGVLGRLSSWQNDNVACLLSCLVYYSRIHHILESTPCDTVMSAS